MALAPKFQFQEVALLDKSVKVIEFPVQVVVLLALKSANVAAQKVELEFIFTVSVDVGHIPLLILQTNEVMVLFVKLLAVVVGDAELVMVHEPPAKVQFPLPDIAVFPFRLIVEPLQIVVSFPALATVGLNGKFITTSSLLAIQGELLIVQRNV